MDDWNERRRELAAMYVEKLGKLAIDGLQLPVTLSYGVPVWHLFVCQVNRRDELLKFLNDQGIGAGIHYPIPIHQVCICEFSSFDLLFFS